VSQIGRSDVVLADQHPPTLACLQFIRKPPDDEETLVLAYICKGRSKTTAVAGRKRQHSWSDASPLPSPLPGAWKPRPGRRLSRRPCPA
jgi:hypothetical protein